MNVITKDPHPPCESAVAVPPFSPGRPDRGILREHLTDEMEIDMYQDSKIRDIKLLDDLLKGDSGWELFEEDEQWQDVANAKSK